MMKKTISTILLLAMLWALCACGTKSQFAGSGYTEPGVSTGNAANTSDNIQSPASGASDSDNMDGNEENEENTNVSLSEENAVYGDEFPEKTVAFTLDMCKDRMDEFAWLITQTRFGDAAKYLHPTLYDALNGDLTEKVDSNTMEIFGTTPVGICPDYCSVESNETIEAKLWGQKMDNITEHLARYNVQIDFDSSKVLEYHYNFGKLYEGSSKYAELVVYEQDGAVIYFSYISTN